MDKRKSATQAQEKAIRKALAPFLAKHPKAQLDMYRRNQYALRLRIIDSAFEGMDLVERDTVIREYLDSLPDDVMDDLTMIVLVTPKETATSIANFDYDNPQPSFIN